MRLPKKKATALALAIGVVGVLVTALPAYAVAAVTSFTPACGVPTAGAVPGTLVTITGTGFAGVTGVTFNGGGGQAALTHTEVSATVETAVVPTGAVTGTITVNTGGADTPSASSFIVASPVAPVVSSFTPPTGPAGTAVTIVGSGFCGTTSVMFNGISAGFTVSSANQIIATVPAGNTTGSIVVTNTVSSAASATSFTSTTTGATTITSFTPTSGPVGTSVIITGTGFLTVTAVRFNGVAAVAPVTNSLTSITAIVPSNATTGRIVVVDANGTATSLTDFTVTAVATPLARTVSFGFDPNSRVSGQVNVTNGTAACHSLVPVIIQKQNGNAWKWADTTATRKSGSFKTYIPPSNGNFRAKVNQITLANGVVCAKSISNVVHS